jgi:hypothetical protein
MDMLVSAFVGMADTRLIRFIAWLLWPFWRIHGSPVLRFVMASEGRSIIVWKIFGGTLHRRTN